MPRHVPYGIALLAAIAMREGHQVQVYDANAWRAAERCSTRCCAPIDWDVIALGGITTAYGSIKHIVGDGARAWRPKALDRARAAAFLTACRTNHGLPAGGRRRRGRRGVRERSRSSCAGSTRGKRDWAAVDGLIWRDGRRAHA